MSINIIVEADKEKIKKQIKALEYQISIDSSLKDKEIDIRALNTLKKNL